ncbi:glycoside hydrolase family 2 protein [Melanomma pulvis-pyrius CBS 109.77]|uniref:Glycoside hydrolase family 2 protein n=1 Tax=Melanomma pulvis-pyrius CBS 109.77 TaxID=1314802 RepID=A0A6A6XJ92_9PLEO|nr:glycoside hydrolase family 2 protein [Melanomma pulvis-pyrius CBS 109.77]
MAASFDGAAGRERTTLNAGWRFARFTSNPDSLSYDTLKPWILPLANDFLAGTKHERPSGTAPGAKVSYVQAGFDDSKWEQLDLPHDWAIKGTFNAPGVGGGLGRLPINGVGWYRRTVSLDADVVASGKSIFLDVDGAMAYSAVWLNGNLVGGWPFGYNSFRLDLTPFAKAGDNRLAIRLDNALESSRWYPGAGIYRNVWLVTVNPVHVAQYGTYVTTPSVSAQKATLDMVVEIENSGNSSQQVEVTTKVYALDPETRKASGDAVARIPTVRANVAGRAKQAVNGSVTIANPTLWGPPPTQKPNEYIAISVLSINGTAVDTYETPFGVRSIKYDANKGVLINGEAVRIHGTCNHHDLGSLGTAFNVRAAERQIQMLQEMGGNALRTSHNPPAPEFLEIADRLGLLVMDEIFDTWNYAKVENDFHRIFPDWHEPDLRSFIRRDRNHPSIISWSVGNELSEQSNSIGGATGKMLQDIVHQEDPTRQVTVGMNNAGPGTALAKAIDIIGLNYQGEGRGTSWSSTFPSFHSTYPDKMIWSTESASTVSSRGIYIFPITNNKSAVVGGGAGQGADPTTRHVSAYELYAPSWASSPDKVFEQQDKNSYVAGEFVWTGWDYIGEPTPYDNSSRSSYFGIIDLAGFKKDRFFLYQARWRPDLPMAHVLPHWTWPDRVGKVTPVHVFTSGDEAELFVNGVTAGRQKKGQYDSRLRWDNVTYAPGSIRVVAYKNGKEWASTSQQTVGTAASITLTADRTSIRGDGHDLSFITVAVVDKDGHTVPRASNEITFSVSSGSGKIVSTDNGDPTDETPFPSLSRKAFSGLALAIVRAEPGAQGDIVIDAKSNGLVGGRVVLRAG